MHRELESAAGCISRLGISVNFLGAIERPKLPEIYQGHDLVCQLSTSEGVSNVVLGSLSSGLGMIALDTAIEPSFPETRAVIRPQSRDEQTIAAAIRDIATNPNKLKRMQADAPKTAQLFDWNRHAERLETHIHSVIRASTT